jgi:hypothetical protein
MKKAFAIACIAAVTLVTETQAADLSFLDGPYEFLDEVVMTFYKPLIWLMIIAPLQSLACDVVTTQLIETLGTVATGMTDAEQTAMCKTGIKMYWEQFFYGGAVGNQPYSGLSWAWTPN